MLRIHLLGSLRLFADDRSIAFAVLPKALPLWAYLLLRRDEVVSREVLAFTMWPDATEEQAKANLRRHLYELRRALPEPPADTPWLLITPQTAQWNPRAPYWLDVAVFQQMAQQPGLLGEAVQLYGGALLPTLDEEWLWFERERLRTLYLGALQRLIQDRRRARDYGAALDYVQRALVEDPLREDMSREEMALHYLLGDRAGAVQAFKRCVARLRDEVGAPPMEKTVALARLLGRNAPVEEVLAFLGEPAQSSAAASAPAAPAPAHNLPVPVRQLIGRQEAVQELAALLAGPHAPARLVTLTGVGGIGKTRLALETARHLRDHHAAGFPDGVFFVPLAQLSDSALVPTAIADVLGVRRRSGRSLVETLADELRYRRLLLLLDNCEHVLPAAADVGTLLAAAPGLRVLATSQALLNLYGEHEYPVWPLAVPDPASLPLIEALAQAPAVALFCEGARAANAHFRLTFENATSVAQICARLGGLPLAIELAAARSKLFSPGEILSQLERALGFLQSRASDLPERHRTLRAAFQWSYDLLDPAQQQLFRRLSLFVSGFTPVAVAAVLFDRPQVNAATLEDEALEALIGLAEKSLIRRVELHSQPRELRFAMLAVLAEFAREKLAADQDRPALQGMYGRFYSATAERHSASLRTAETAQHLAWLRAEEDNLRRALEWAFDASANPASIDHGVILALALGNDFWSMQGRLPEASRWLDLALAHRTTQAPQQVVRLLNLAGNYAHLQGDYEAAFGHTEAGLEIARQLGDRSLICRTLHFYGMARGRHGDFEEAETLLTEALTLERQLAGGEITANLVVSTANLGLVARHLGNLDRARQLAMESLDLFRKRGHALGMASSLSELGQIAVLQGDLVAAQDHYRTSIGLSRPAGDRTKIVNAVGNIAMLALARGEYDVSARLASAAAAQREWLRFPMTGAERQDFERRLAQLRELMDRDQFAAAWAHGAALTLEQAAAEAEAWLEASPAA